MVHPRTTAAPPPFEHHVKTSGCALSVILPNSGMLIMATGQRRDALDNQDQWSLTLTVLYFILHGDVMNVRGGQSAELPSLPQCVETLEYRRRLQGRLSP